MKKRPIAYLVAGPPGSGKTTTAQALAREQTAALLDLDSLTNPLVAVVSRFIKTDNLDSAELSSAVRSPRYEALRATAHDCLKVGLSTVLVAPFTAEINDQEALTNFTAPFADVGARSILIWLEISPQTLLKRMVQRDAARDRHKLRDPQNYLANIDLTPPQVPHVRINAEIPVPTQVQKIISTSTEI